MDIRIPIIIVIILGSLFFKNMNNGKRMYITLITIILVLESCLRSMFFGPDDTYVYYLMFNQYPDISKLDILQLFKDDYVNHELYAKDPGFIVLIAAFHLISDSYQFFLLFAALLFFVPLGKILYRYSNGITEVRFAYILHMALFHVIAMCCLRQQIATGISFIIFLSVMDGKYRRAILLFIIGLTIHKSLVLILLPLCLLQFFRNNIKTIHYFSFVLGACVLVLAHQVVGALASFTNNDYYMNYAESQGSGYTFLALGELCSLFCLIGLSSKEYIQQSKVNSYLYCMLPCMTVTIPLITVDGAMIRICQYYTLYLMLLLPAAIHKYFNIDGRANRVQSIIELILIILTFISPFEYFFFWEKIANPYNI